MLYEENFNLKKYINHFKNQTKKPDQRFEDQNESIRNYKQSIREYRINYGEEENDLDDIDEEDDDYQGDDGMSMDTIEIQDLNPEQTTITENEDDDENESNDGDETKTPNDVEITNENINENLEILRQVEHHKWIAEKQRIFYDELTTNIN